MFIPISDLGHKNLRGFNSMTLYDKMNLTFQSHSHVAQLFLRGHTFTT